jgi:AraC family transcriptional regulator, regulatory protein of adaptative response / DNA-3-methyladenine glycosylase II
VASPDATRGDPIGRAGPVRTEATQTVSRVPHCHVAIPLVRDGRGRQTDGVHEDPDRCYLAVTSRDPRFDGWFVTAVTSTGIYCRPSCPARTPHRRNVRFLPTAAAAQRAGFRACKRCRPDATPGSPEWDGRADVVARAMRLIADGVIDRSGVPGLAAALGYSVRQLERVLVAEVGAGPVALARAQRAQTARVLIETTDLPMTEIAFAAGFASIRQFNDTVRAVFAVAPTGLRTGAAGSRTAGRLPGSLALRLPFRRPLTPDTLFGHLAATAVPGVEEVVGTTYRRTLRLPHGPGVVALTPASTHVDCTVDLADLADLTAAIARCRRLLDLDADPEEVDAVLGADPALVAAVAAAPGRRVPRTVDGDEFAVRAVVGQQVSTAAARTAAASLVAAHGEALPAPTGGLTHLFPAPADLVGARPALPAARVRTLAVLAEALVDGRLDLGPGADRDDARRVLAGLPGIGPWTVEMVALRALADPDAFPVGDLGVLRGAGGLGLPDRPGALGGRAERWRPWRAYAVQHLWAASGHPAAVWPPDPPTTRPDPRTAPQARPPADRPATRRMVPSAGRPTRPRPSAHPPAKEPARP